MTPQPPEQPRLERRIEMWRFPYRWGRHEMIYDHPFQGDEFAGCADCRHLRSRHAHEVAAAPDPVARPPGEAQGEPDAQATDLDDPGLHSQPRPLDAGASPEGRELRLAPDPVATPAPLDALPVTRRDLADTICFVDGHDRPSDRSACDGCEDFAAAAFQELAARRRMLDAERNR